MTDDPSSVMDESADAARVDPVAITFNGTSVLLARSSGARMDVLHYNVRNPNAEPGAVDEWGGWRAFDLSTLPSGSADPEPMLRMAGVDLVTVPQSFVPEASYPHPANAPFRVVTDQRTITLVRLSETGTLLIDRLVLVETAASPERSASAGGPAIVGFQLQRVLEVRYRRSGRKDVPEGPYDTLGTTNMVGDLFFEPTTELSVLPSIFPGGDFEVLLVPTKSGGFRVHFFVVPSPDSNQVTCASFPQDASGRVAIVPGWPSFTLNPTAQNNVAGAVAIPLQCNGSLAGCIYQELEPSVLSPESILRRTQRVMLTIPVSFNVPISNGLAIYDFPILADGTIPPPPANASCIVTDGSIQNGAFAETSPAPASFPVPALASYSVGSVTVYATFLGVPKPGRRPQLLNGADGLVHVYFGGPSDEGQPFLVAQYNPRVIRAALAIPWVAGTETEPGATEGQLLLTATRAGMSMSRLWITMDPDPSYPDLFSFRVDYGSLSGLSPWPGVDPIERWNGIPRDVRVLSSILSGNAGDDPDDPSVRAGSIPFYDYSGTLEQIRLPLSQPVSETTHYLTLLSHRPDVPLVSASVAAPSDGQTTLTIAYALPTTSGSTTITQTWSSVPVKTPALMATLSGTDPSYGYAPGEDDVAIYPIGTSGGTILAFAPAGSHIHIKISPASDHDPTHCNLVISTKGGSTISMENTSRKQDALIAAIVYDVGNPFLYLSPDPTGGMAGDQQVRKPLDLRGSSMLFDFVPPPVAGKVTAVTATASVLQGRTFSVPFEGALPNALLELVVSNPKLPPPGETARVQFTSENSNRGTVTTPANGQWEIAQPVCNGVFNGSSAFYIPLTSVSASVLAPTPEMTIEAWCQPSSSASSVLVAYNGMFSNTMTAGQPSYLLGLMPNYAAEFAPAEGGTPPYALCGGEDEFIAAGPFWDLTSYAGFTFECWVNISEYDPNQQANSSIFEIWALPSQQAPSSNAYRCLTVYLDNDLHPSLYVHTSAAPSTDGQSASTTGISLGTGVWTHLAIVGVNVNARSSDPDATPSWTITFYLNGAEAGTTKGLAFAPVEPAGSDITAFQLALGSAYQFPSSPSWTSVSGLVNEVRLWQAARSQADILSTKDRPLLGTEPDLLAYWPLTDSSSEQFAYLGPFNDTGGYLNLVNNGLGNVPQGVFTAVVAGVNGASPVAGGHVPSDGEWHHIAAVSSSVGALTFPPVTTTKPPLVLCEKPEGLAIGSEATFEAWVILPAVPGATSTLYGIWGVGQENQSYQLGVDNAGHPFFQINVWSSDVPAFEPYKIVTATYPESVADGKPHHIAATVKIVKPSSTSGGRYGCILTMFVDGVSHVTSSTTITKSYHVLAPLEVRASDAPFTVGMSNYVPPGKSQPLIAQELFSGTITGIRIWNRVLDLPDLKKAMKDGPSCDRRKGVVAAWWFFEQKGEIAKSTVGVDTLKVDTASAWSTFAPIARVQCVVDGITYPMAVPVGSSTLATAAYCTSASTMFVGGYCPPTTPYLSPELGLTASLQELRIWSIARTPVQIANTANRPLTGTETGLRGYWPLDNDFFDLSGNQNNGVALVGSNAPTFAPSTAPVGNEAPQVRNVYGGQKIPYQQNIAGTPAVWEMASVESDPGKPLEAGLHRAYSWVPVANAPLQMSTGYGVGELEAVYLGQVQTSPTLIGYIEGPPPVPSENLSRPLYQSALGFNGYADCATLRLAQTTGADAEYAAGVDFDAGGSFGLNAGWETELKASMGLGYQVRVQDVTLTKEGGLSEEMSGAWGRKYKYESSWETHIQDTVGLRGTWETAQAHQSDYLNPTIGRRYVPSNSGYALVQSLTADFYSLQLKGTGVMYGRTVVPNPNQNSKALSNILRFEINPTYVKNGTLDGKVGFVNDPDYPDAHIRPGSYFKPDEAQRLEAMIEQDTARQLAYAQNYQPMHTPATPPSPLGRLSRPATKQVASFDDQGQATPKRGIANSYVWSAWGGLHREEQEVAAKFEASFSGEFCSETSLEGSVDSKVLFFAGAIGSLDLSADFTVTQTNDSSLAEKFSLALTANVVGEPFLQAYDQDLQAYTEGPAPGKVQSYRFTSFYLPPSGENASAFMNQVVDKAWLDGSSDPNAIALRSTVIEGNSVWRVLHRVTYVNRVPPTFDSNPAAQAGTAVPNPISTDDDLLLIGLVQNGLGSLTVSRSNLGAAVEEALEQLGESASWWSQFMSAANSQPGTPEAAFLQQTETAAMAYFLAGYMNRQLPLMPPNQPPPAGGLSLRGRRARWDGKRASKLGPAPLDHPAKNGEAASHRPAPKGELREASL